MATLNIVPRAANEGSLGTSAKPWLSAYIATLYSSNLIRWIFASSFDNPNNANWVVNALATCEVDDDNNALSVRAFDDTAEEGVGFTALCPAGAASMVINFIGKAKTGPGVAKVVSPHLYFRGIPDNAAVEAWSGAFDCTNLTIPITGDPEYYQYDTQTITIGGGGGQLNLTVGEWNQFELTRDPADTLVGDWYLLAFGISWI